jgi:hypothetical protein
MPFRRIARPAAISAFALTVLLIAGTAIGQQVSSSTASAPPPRVDTLYFNSKIGSLKIQGANEDPAEGRIELSFSGTLLVSGLDGRIGTSGNLRREYLNQKFNRQVYSGTGTVIIEGGVRAIQWFGRDMEGKFTGPRGIVRLYGEFDRNLDTGFYWYEGEQEKKHWGIYGMTLTLPRMGPNTSVVPQRRSGGQ